MSYYVPSDGVVIIEAGTKFPAACPECPAYIPLFDWMTINTHIVCWNCSFSGPLHLFIEDAAYKFTAERIQ